MAFKKFTQAEKYEAVKTKDIPKGIVQAACRNCRKASLTCTCKR